MLSAYRETLAGHKYNVNLNGSTTTATPTISQSSFEYQIRNRSSSENSSDSDLNFGLHSHSLENNVQLQRNELGQRSTDLMNDFNNSLDLSQNLNRNLNGNDLPQPETESDSTVILCAILIPLLIAFVVILIVALLIRRMRRADNMKNHAIYDEVGKIADEQQWQSPNIYNPKNSLRLPVILGLEPLDPAVLNSISRPTDNTDNKNTTWTETNCPSPSNDDYVHIENSSLNSNTNGDAKFGIYEMKRATPTSETITPPVGLVGRILNALDFPKRLRERKAERDRFNIYTVSLETREQLKHIYVY